jgi:hypothetical protein
MDKGTVKPYKYMAKRWSWGFKRTYNLYVDMGIYRTEKMGSQKGAGGEPEGSQEGAGVAESGEESTAKGASGEPEGSEQGAEGEQYYQTQTQTQSNNPPSPPEGGSPPEAGAEKKRRRAAVEKEIGLLVIPSGLDTEEFRTAWSRWIECRRRKKAPKDWIGFFANQLAWLEKYGAELAVKILEKSTLNDYTGLIEPKEGENAADRKRNSGSVPPRGGSAHERRLNLTADRVAESREQWLRGIGAVPVN